MAEGAEAAFGSRRVRDIVALPRAAQGIPTLVHNAITGKNAMPPKGGAANASEADIKAVVTYMVNASK